MYMPLLLYAERMSSLEESTLHVKLIRGRAMDAPTGKLLVLGESRSIFPSTSLKLVSLPSRDE